MKKFRKQLVGAAVVSVLAGCGILPTDETTAADPPESGAQSEETAAPETEAVSPQAESDVSSEVSATDEAAATETQDNAAIAEGLRIGRTGPIRELPGLAAWSELDLQPFLVEVMMFPEEVPVPTNAVLTWVSARQSFSSDGTSSRFEVNARYQPMFSIDEFRTLIPEMLAGTSFLPTAVDEDLEDNSVRLEFSSEDPSAPFRRLSFIYTDADSANQATLQMYTTANEVAGRSEIMVNTALFPWAADIVVDPAMVNDFISYDIGRLEGKAEIDRRWDGPVTDFERLSEFYRTPTGTDFVVDSEMEYDEAVWPRNRVDVVRADGFDGRITIGQPDPERAVSLIVRGSYVLS